MESGSSHPSLVFCPLELDLGLLSSPGEGVAPFQSHPRAYHRGIDLEADKSQTWSLLGAGGSSGLREVVDVRGPPRAQAGSRWPPAPPDSQGPQTGRGAMDQLRKRLLLGLGEERPEWFPKEMSYLKPWAWLGLTIGFHCHGQGQAAG